MDDNQRSTNQIKPFSWCDWQSDKKEIYDLKNEYNFCGERCCKRSWEMFTIAFLRFITWSIHMQW